MDTRLELAVNEWHCPWPSITTHSPLHLLDQSLDVVAAMAKSKKDKKELK